MKIGDKYIVRKWNDMAKEFGIMHNYFGDRSIDIPIFLFTEEMRKYCGKIVTVSLIHYDGTFDIVEDYGSHGWSLDMVRPLDGRLIAFYLMERKHENNCR